MDMCSRMVLERKKLESVVEGVDIHCKEDAIAYADALTKLIWNHNLLGLVYEYYDESVVYKCANGIKITRRDAIVEKFLSIQAPFPDLRVHISESFASGDEATGFVVYQRSYCEGTNLGASLYGPATGNVLNEKNSMGQTVYILKKMQDKWKICSEFSLRSQSTIEKLLKNKM